MKTIILHGILAKKFGKSFDLDVKTAKEACHAIACQMPDFYAFMMNAEKQGIRFAIFNGKGRTLKTNISEKQLDDITTSGQTNLQPLTQFGKSIGKGINLSGVRQIHKAS